jgi:uncharacterized protein (DUF924 family)
MDIDPHSILHYWFNPPVNRQWFSASVQLDVEIRTRFEPTWQQAVAGGLAGWRETAEGCLALVILFDQFPLNMYRGEAKSFASEALAREVARTAIAQGVDRQLGPAQRSFLYMPFMHSESLSDQDYSVRLYAQAGLADNLAFARHHRGIIERFGRFPHRNAILGRVSSAEEQAYLVSDEAFNG